MKIAVATKDDGGQVSGRAGMDMNRAPTALTRSPTQAALPWPAAPAGSPPAEACRDGLQAALLGRPVSAAVQADPLRPLWASLLAGRALQQGVLTARLGLLPDDWLSLWEGYFPGAPWQLADGPGEHIVELDDLLQLLLEYRAGRCASERWLAHSLAWACSGRNHLWQDLGLANRGELSLLMHTAFPALAGLNGGDMKWKKFIYRHYCAREGIYVCPAPSCGECSDYSLCFAKEE